MPKYALLLEYEGSHFHGYQSQNFSSLPTIQKSIEDAIFIVLNEKVKLETAGRTDTGVHSKGLVISFYSNYKIKNLDKFNFSINALTNKNLAVINSMLVPDIFHARFDCTAREYEYWILNTKFPHPLFYGKSYWMKHPLDLKKIQVELTNLIGLHNFSSLCKQKALKVSSPERNILDVSIFCSSEFSGLLKVRIKGSGFLHNMVRIIVGTLVDIGRGKVENILDIINSKDRAEAGTTLPPYGLYFLRAYYDKYPEIEKLYQGDKLY